MLYNGNMEYNLVEIWLRRDPVRWFSGVLAGLLAGAVAMGLGMMLAVNAGLETWFPIKLVGTILIGPSATGLGAQYASGIIAGAAISAVAFSFLGAVFAHFTGTNSLKALLPMGVVWGLFSWIFIWNLFMQSFRPIYAAQISSAAVFPICITFGVALASVSFFDGIFRRK